MVDKVKPKAQRHGFSPPPHRLNLSALDADIMIMVQQATSIIDNAPHEHGRLTYVLPLIVHLKF